MNEHCERRRRWGESERDRRPDRYCGTNRHSAQREARTEKERKAGFSIEVQVSWFLHSSFCIAALISVPKSIGSYLLVPLHQTWDWGGARLDSAAVKELEAEPGPGPQNLKILVLRSFLYSFPLLIKALQIDSVSHKIILLRKWNIESLKLPMVGSTYIHFSTRITFSPKKHYVEIWANSVIY